MSKKYGIKFSGPIRKDIWWKQDGPGGKVKLTFSDINDACQWSDNATRQFPHCQYIVQELPNEKQEAKTTQGQKSLYYASAKTKSRSAQGQAF